MSAEKAPAFFFIHAARFLFASSPFFFFPFFCTCTRDGLRASYRETCHEDSLWDGREKQHS
jgi:hypothetical protein